ncbi:MAG: hypothetical protein J3R72DRAFT_529178 [Linnemannia gamsii]|nr:MAG: hypothetical protein J3R72DRAFT_529178 [Linnemannia gamsii]
MVSFNIFKSKKSKGQPHTQAFRIIQSKQKLPNTNSSNTSTTSLSLPSGEVFLIDCHTDPATKKDFILWEDIQQICSDVAFVKNETRVVPYLKGADLRPLEPRRIAAVPNVVLDVVAGGELPAIPASLPGKAAYSSLLRPDRIIRDDSSSTASQPPAPRRNPEGDANTAMENYNYMTSPANAIARRGPHGTSEGDATAKKQEDDDDNNSNDDTASAVMTLLVKANLGDTESEVTLGDVYRGGIGVPQNLSAALVWYQKAADKGHARAQYYIGLKHDQGWGEIEKDNTKAFEWFLKSSLQGLPEAQFQVARAYMVGLGVGQDLPKATEWLHKAAEQGHAYSQFSLAAAYAEGQGVPKDVRKATAWALKAAEQGHVAAQRLMGLMYEIGQGVPMDVSKARAWYLKAAVNGNQDAKRSLQRLQV